MKTKRLMEVDTYICDFCGKERPYKFAKCIVCERDVCSDCNKAGDLLWKGKQIYLCPECYSTVPVSEIIRKLKNPTQLLKRMLFQRG